MKRTWINSIVGLFLVLIFLCAGCGGNDTDQQQEEKGKMDNPAEEGTLATFPVKNYAGYPFSPDCYEISVKEAEGHYATYPGLIKEIIYGFTSSSKDEYLQNNDVPWENTQGELVHEGVINTTHKHDGGYKGSYQLVPPDAVRVPAKKNLVFKLRIEKYSGKCQFDESRLVENTLTKTYFVDLDLCRPLETYGAGTDDPNAQQLGFIWNGIACTPLVGFYCNGADCDRLTATQEDCEAAFSHCLGSGTE